MPLIKREIPALYGGVSQQPPILRTEAQSEVEVNCYASIVDGNAKRPPVQHVAVISGSALGPCYIHGINRDAVEQYNVVITNGAIKVNHVDGTSRTVNYPAGTGYLTSSSPQTDFHCVTVGDYTFVVNKNVTVAMASLAAEQAAQPTYQAWLNRNGYKSGWTSYQQYVTATTYGETYRGQVQVFAKLPGETGVSGPGPAEGDLYHILGSSTDSGFGGYYVARHNGVWNETVMTGLLNMIDATTMPHALIRNADSTFTFTTFSWNYRRVGDDTLNPAPSFVNRKIRDVFFHKNRLGLCADENVILSAAGDFGNFFRLTVLDLLASEVVDLAASSTTVNYFNYAVPFNNNLMLFADQAQYQLNAVQAVTPTTCSLDGVTKYEMSHVCKPVGIGQDVYFISEKSNYATVWNYYVRDNVIVNDAEEITAHCPRFIPAGVIKMAECTERDMLFVLTTGDQNSIYVYHFAYVGGKRVQSCFGRWDFDPADTVLNIDVINSKLYLLVQRGSAVTEGFIDLLPLATPSDLTFDPLLDKRVVLTGTYSSGFTTYVLPYACNPTNFQVVYGGAWGAMSGALVDPSTYTFTNGNTQVKLPGDLSANTMYLGEVYNQQRQFSQVFHHDRDGVNIETGRFQIRTCTVYYSNSAYFETYVDTYGVGSNGDSSTESLVPANITTFDAKTLGTAALMAGTPVFASGAYSFTVMGDSKTCQIILQNPSYVQSRFVSATFEGLYWNREGPTMPG